MVSLLVRPIPGFHLNDLLSLVELRAHDRPFGYLKPNQVGFDQDKVYKACRPDSKSSISGEKKLIYNRLFTKGTKGIVKVKTTLSNIFLMTLLASTLTILLLVESTAIRSRTTATITLIRSALGQPHSRPITRV